MKSFGGNWTEDKIDILVKYAKAYLTIMNKYPYWKLLYFDGFAGSGLIDKGIEDNKYPIIGAARRIIEINEPKPFDVYYFVELDRDKAEELKRFTKDVFPERRVEIAIKDCNEKIIDLAIFLKSEAGRSYKVLAYIDPCGMQLNWNSLISLANTDMDIWILIPTGLGVNRLLKRNGEISETWLDKLECFLGLPKDEILSYFYSVEVDLTLFGEETFTKKEENAINRSAELYRKRLEAIFKYVSHPYLLKNSMGTIMYHFLMASNNGTAVKIANDIIKKY